MAQTSAFISSFFRREDVDLILSLYCTYSHVWCFDDHPFHNQTFLNLSGPFFFFFKYQTKQHLQTNGCRNLSEIVLQLLLTSWFQSDCHFYFGKIMI